jgi:8-oxo-dGTP diphosphatase
MHGKQVFSHYERGGPSAGEFRYCPSCGASLALAERGGRQRPVCPACGFVQYQNPAPAVSILIVEDGRIVLGRRLGEPGRGTWALPSGYVEFDEDFGSTAVREALEETGLDITVRAVINVVSSFVSPRFHFLGIYVLADVSGGSIRSGDDLEEVAWFPLEGPLPALGFEEDAYAIELVKKGLAGPPMDLELDKWGEG